MWILPTQNIHCPLWLVILCTWYEWQHTQMKVERMVQNSLLLHRSLVRNNDIWSFFYLFSLTKNGLCSYAKIFFKMQLWIHRSEVFIYCDFYIVYLLLVFYTIENIFLTVFVVSLTGSDFTYTLYIPKVFVYLFEWFHFFHWQSSVVSFLLVPFLGRLLEN